MGTDAGASGADWGFRPMPNGFAFENYGNQINVDGMMSTATNLTAEEVRRLAGPQVCEGNNATGECVLVPQARRWMETQNTGMNGGHCEGMAVLASNIYSGSLMASTYGAPSTFGVRLPNNTALQREVAFWAAGQALVPNLERGMLTPRQVVAELERELARGTAYRGTVLGLYTSPGRGNGHAVTPFAVRRPREGQAEIAVYDNNYPNMERVVTVDLNADTFTYRTSTNPMEPQLDYIGNATTLTLTLNDIAPRLAPPYPCDFCGNAEMMTGMGNRGALRVRLLGEGDLSITDAMNRVTGTGAMGAIVNGIPGSSASSVRTSFRDSPEPIYTVPREGTLTLTLDGARLARAAGTELFVSGAGFSLGVEDINLDPMQRDTVTLRTDSPDIAYRASGSETPTLVLAFQTADADYLIELRSSAVTNGQTLRLRVNLATQRALVSFDGSTSAPTFEFYMERVSTAGVVSFDHRGVAGTAASVLGFDYSRWSGNGAVLRMEVDTDGNGSVERTEDLTDQN
jgi:hypothetical protein